LIVRSTLTVAACALAAAAAAVTQAAYATAAPAAGAASASVSLSHVATTSRSAPVPYPGCPAGAVTLTLVVPRDPVPAGQTVHYAVTLRNQDPQACGPAHATFTITNGRSLRSALLNPCGALPLTIDSQGGEQVYPPFEAVLCPYLVAPKLKGQSAVTAVGGWNQFVGGGGRPARRSQLAPRGTYRIVVDHTVRAPVVLAPARASSAGRRASVQHKGTTMVTRSGHVAFEGCPTKNIVATVSVPAHPSVGSPVRYTVTLINDGASLCGPTELRVQPARAGLTVGPCGILPAVVRNGAGVNIYPGPVAFSCPADWFIDIPAHTSVTATGVWPGSQALGPALPQVSAAPPGRYRIEVGERPAVVSVPFTLVVAATPT
jgi:hypothetical protein